MNQTEENNKKYEKEFSDRLRFLRNERNLSAREMSLSLGQNVNYINLIENGKRSPSMQAFFSICEYLSITPSEFFNFAEDEETISKEKKFHTMPKWKKQIANEILTVIENFSEQK
ncbi:MAG: helix-turn-helix domain-containing protein [Treponema sp.]